MFKQKLIERRIIDKRNNLKLTMYKWQTPYGIRYGYELAVTETDPFIENLGNSDGNGFCTIGEAEADAQETWRHFALGDELCQGVFKV